MVSDSRYRNAGCADPANAPPTVCRCTASAPCSATWRRKNDRFVKRTIPDGAKPLSDPANTGRFFLETQFPALIKLATAIANFDSVFAEVAAATEIAKDIRVWNPNLKDYRVHFGAIRAILYAVQASRKLDLPRPIDAP